MLFVVAGEFGVGCCCRGVDVVCCCCLLLLSVVSIYLIIC